MPVPHPQPDGTPAADGAHPRRIVLSWLVRLRWLAVAGQVVAVGLATVVLGVDYPLRLIAVVLGTTLVTNAAAAAWVRHEGAVPRWLTPAVLLLDVLLLTALLGLTGGTHNPFVMLFAVHVAMAAVVLGPRWAWATAGVVAACYAALTLWGQPLTPGRDQPLAAWVSTFGQAAALAVVVALLAYFIGRVIASLRRREAELASVRERAQANERLAALTTLAAGAAHELGTPLGTIAVVAKEMELSARSRDEAELADDAALVRQQVERCRQILDHLRGDVAGRGTDEPGDCDPIDVARLVADRLRPDRRSRLDVHAPPDLPRAAAPSRATQQAVGFLVNNAFDASPHDRRVSLRLHDGDGRIAFAVIDRGGGMDADTLRRATEPFFTTKDPGRGMGLGLFLVRLVAERNGGDLALDSTPGAGTTATLTLPATHGERDAR